MSKNLVIVESPAKAKTIEKFLGNDYQVMSSFGHIRDLAEKGIGIDFENNYKPEYIVSTDKKKVVSESLFQQSGKAAGTGSSFEKSQTDFSFSIWEQQITYRRTFTRCWKLYFHYRRCQILRAMVF